MATQEIGHETELARALAFLAEQGIAPDATGAYAEDEVVRAIAGRGWVARIAGALDDWTAEVGEDHAPLDLHLMMAGSTTRQGALLRALDAALEWVDRDAARYAFDQEARARLGVGGEEFLRRWEAGELDPDT